MSPGARPAPAVSVLLPVRDAAPTLGEAMAALARQSLRDFEVLAVDDGSRDESRALLAAQAARDARWRVSSIGSPGRGAGLVAALNQAVRQARAPLLARFDADDVCAPERLALQAARLLAEPTLDVLGSRVALWPARDVRANAGMHRYVEWLNSLVDHATIVRDLYVESPLAHPSVMLRAGLLRRLGGYRAFDGPEDYDLWLRAAAAGARFGKCPQVLLAWRDHPARLTRADPRYGPARFQALKLAALERGPLAGRPELLLWGGGPLAKGWLRALHARGHAVRALVDVAPRRIGQRVAGVPVWSLRDVARYLDGPGRGARSVHLAAVGQPGARQRIRTVAAGLGLRDGHDLWAVA